MLIVTGEYLIINYKNIVDIEIVRDYNEENKWLIMASTIDNYYTLKAYDNKEVAKKAIMDFIKSYTNKQRWYYFG